MTNPTSIIHYRTAMSVFKKWLEKGIISESDYQKLDDILSAKYGLTNSGIYR